MGAIYVVAGTMDVRKADKNFATMAKKSMTDAVQAAVKKDNDLTDKEGEGYKVGMKLLELKVDGDGASCKLTGDLSRLPKAEMVNSSVTVDVKADSKKPEVAVKTCVDAAAERFMTKIIPVMKNKAR